MPDHVLSSTAKRARGTARRVVKPCDYAGEVELHSELYLGDPSAYLDVLRWLPDDMDRVLVIGHNPGLEELIEHITGRHEALPTAGLAEINLPIERWSDLTDSTRGELLQLLRPKELKRGGTQKADGERPLQSSPEEAQRALA